MLPTDSENEVGFSAEHLRFAHLLLPGGSSESGSDGAAPYTDEDTALNDSDKIEWKDIYDAFRHDSKVLLMTHGGGPCGVLAIDLFDPVFILGSTAKVIFIQLVCTDTEQC